MTALALIPKQIGTTPAGTTAKLSVHYRKLLEKIYVLNFYLYYILFCLFIVYSKWLIWIDSTSTDSWAGCRGEACSWCLQGCRSQPSSQSNQCHGHQGWGHSRGEPVTSSWKKYKMVKIMAFHTVFIKGMSVSTKFSK